MLAWLILKSKMWGDRSRVMDIRRNIRNKTINKMTKQFYYLSATLIYFLISCVVFCLLNYAQKAPLIDEVFHIPQAISYIKGNFSEWNPKITTLPGLYILTSAIFNFIAFALDAPVELLCKPFFMRFFNLVLSVYTLYTIYSILTFDDFSSRKILSPKKAFWVSLNMAIFPISYFFNHFYYTDTLSTLVVIMMYREHLLNNFGKAALLGTCAIMVRQTNVVWVGFLMINVLFHTCQKMLHRSNLDQYFVNPVMAIRKLYEEKLWKAYMKKCFKNLQCYILVCLSFALFLYYNGGIVVGDKDAHVPVVHVCQVFYFSLFMLFFGFPHFLLSFKDFIYKTIEKKRIALISLIACLLVIYFNTMAHPYLLADNRHYTFYVWKRFYEKHYLLKYLLAPVYLFGIYAISHNLDVFKSIQFWFCTCLCLIPQQLLELRYFIIPYLMLRLEISYTSSWSTIIELFWFVVINCLTIYTFVTKEFYWPDSLDIQRIIW